MYVTNCTAALKWMLLVLHKQQRNLLWLHSFLKKLLYVDILKMRRASHSPYKGIWYSIYSGSAKETKPKYFNDLC